MQLSIALAAVVAVAALALTGVPGAQAYNILGIFPTTSKSHHFSGGALLRGLAKAGHNVTMISPFPLSKPMPNYRDIAVLGLEDIMNGESSRPMINHQFLEKLTLISFSTLLPYSPSSIQHWFQMSY